MKKTILALSAVILAAPAFAAEPRVHTTRDSGSYEASLRLAGVPLSGGLAWGARGAVAKPVATANTTRH